VLVWVAGEERGREEGSSGRAERRDVPAVLTRWCICLLTLRSCCLAVEVAVDEQRCVQPSLRLPL
jgi:hypothetical protein